MHTKINFQTGLVVCYLEFIIRGLDIHHEQHVYALLVWAYKSRCCTRNNSEKTKNTYRVFYCMSSSCLSICIATYRQVIWHGSRKASFFSILLPMFGQEMLHCPTYRPWNYISSSSPFGIVAFTKLALYIHVREMAWILDFFC